MSDAISALKDRISKSESKVLRLEKSLDSERKSLADLHTALRVMAEIAGESVEVPERAAPARRQLEILEMLGKGEKQAYSPARLFETYKLLGSDDISIDTFRTTLWRMKNGIYVGPSGDWVVLGDDGKYWREPYGKPENVEAPDAETSEASDVSGPLGGERGYPPSAPEGSNPSGSTPARTRHPAWDEDLDSDVPF